jgi:hypothetical protein
MTKKIVWGILGQGAGRKRAYDKPVLSSARRRNDSKLRKHGGVERAGAHRRR